MKFQIFLLINISEASITMTVYIEVSGILLKHIIMKKIDSLLVQDYEPFFAMEVVHLHMDRNLLFYP